MYKKAIVVIVFSIISIQTYAQLDEGSVAVDYTLAPLSDDGIDFSKTSANFSFPIKLKKGVLINSVGVDYFKMSYSDNFGIESKI